MSQLAAELNIEVLKPWLLLRCWWAISCPAHNADDEFLIFIAYQPIDVFIAVHRHIPAARHLTRAVAVALMTCLSPLLSDLDPGFDPGVMNLLGLVFVEFAGMLDPFGDGEHHIFAGARCHALQTQ